jgi:hypothetical protein
MSFLERMRDESEIIRWVGAYITGWSFAMRAVHDDLTPMEKRVLNSCAALGSATACAGALLAASKPLETQAADANSSKSPSPKR